MERRQLQFWGEGGGEKGGAEEKMGRGVERTLFSLFLHVWKRVTGQNGPFFGSYFCLTLYRRSGIFRPDRYGHTGAAKVKRKHMNDYCCNTCRKKPFFYHMFFGRIFFLTLFITGEESKTDLLTFKLRREQRVGNLHLCAPTVVKGKWRRQLQTAFFK